MTVTTTRRALLKATPVIAASALLTAPASAAPTSADLLGWERAKAAYLAAVDHAAVLGKRFSEWEAEMFADKKTAPTATIEYTAEGFTHGPVTMASYASTVDVSRGDYKSEYVVSRIGGTPEYAAFCRAVEAWEARPERVSLLERKQQVQVEWEAAVEGCGATWATAVEFPLSDTALVSEKIALLQRETEGDGGLLTELLNAVAADLARVNGRPV
ncbi:hypothetical protein [Novosphingobium kaempferiae]|uniref:hypothetical protein n=1 Tax=Novosphingobium kaempferiae TaxID=2896849 RepID=UPI001E3998F4|nr:hypothetical protein [Novosphingobium kaempferiae]